MEFQDFRTQLKDFLATSGMSQNELAIATKVAQSQISGWVNDRGARFGRVPKKVMDYIDQQNRSKNGTICPELEKAIISFCGNCPKRSRLLTVMIEAMKEI